VVAVGGALGGAVTALVAPLVFPTVVEYPLAIVAALAMCPGVAGRVRAAVRLDTRTIGPVGVVAGVLVLALLVSAIGAPEGIVMTAVVLGCAGLVAVRAAVAPRAFAAAIAVLSILTVLPATDTLVTERSFFGVSRVRVDDRGRHQLMSGSTLHGVQDLGSADPLRPLVYYFPEGPIGQHFRLAQPREVAAIGLGSGALAGYGRPGDHFTFYEIDPAVVRIARDRRLFTYLSDTPADVDIVMGDGRLRLGRSRAIYDTLVLDAFSSDAIPVHLLTREAFTGYLDRLAPDGVIAVHITNRYFDLEPVLTRIAADLGLVGSVNRFTPTAAQRDASAAEHTVWVMLARDPAALADLSDRTGWEPLDPAGAGPAWTDSFSDILGVLDPR
jgi:hypothetical protein